MSATETSSDWRTKVEQAQRRWKVREIALTWVDVDVLDAEWVRFFRIAREQAEVLIVALPLSDDARNADRQEVLSALQTIDDLLFIPPGDEAEMIELVRPTVLVIHDSEAMVSIEQVEHVKARGGRVFRNPMPLRQRVVPQTFSPAVVEFVGKLKHHTSPESLLELLDRVSKMRVLLIGESIIDEYHYCEAMGKAGKEPILAVRHDSVETFAGGVLATANQVAEFAEGVSLLSVLGTVNSHEALIRSRLKESIDASFLYQTGSPTTVKRRYVEKYPVQKLFEVYTMDDELSPAISSGFCARLNHLLQRVDLVIVTDYGHGLMTPAAIELICRQAPFLAVNTQTNSANQGYNTISKYPRADFVCISEKEFRIEARSRTRELDSIMIDVSRRCGARAMIATRGEQGSFCFARDTGFLTVPAFTGRIVDRIGAGDAVLSLTSMLACLNVSMDLVGLMGNAIGALAVEMVGHREAVSRKALIEKLFNLLALRSER
jgi:bifunctional ADP-heptose synthase (sugar kinase/adenylyltransferase)